jgi:HD-like signal output (HDOD) protein
MSNSQSANAASTATVAAPVASESPRDVLLRRINEDGSLPTLGLAITQVVDITSSVEDSVSKLAHCVLSDVALTQKVLRLSNTIHYRTSSGMPVTTISRAIFLLGFNTVKTSALSMLLVDCFKNKTQADTVRKELGRALCASVVGRELSQRSIYQDAEEAAVAALFKNVGRLLVASFDHPMFMRIQSMSSASKVSEQDPVTSVLGCSYVKFGESVLRDWGIPDTIIHAMQNVPAGEQKKAASRIEWLRQVANFSDEIAEKVLSPTAVPLSQRCATLLPRYGKCLDLDQAKLDALIAHVEHETRALAKSIDLSMPAIVADVEEPEGASTNGVPNEFLLSSYDSAHMEHTSRHPSGKPTNARDLLLAGVQDVTQMLTSDQVKLNDMILLVLETLYTAMGFRFATACLRDLQAQRYVARVAVGEAYADRQRSFAFPITSELDVFQLAMANNVDLMIADATVPKIAKLLPSWHRSLLPDTRSFILLPLVIQKKSLGFFYADRAVTAEEGIPPDETALIKTLKSQLMAAMMRK